MVGSRLNVLLYRDSFNTPWGFRLQGGKDLNQPLVVQRVFSNSPAEGELQRGDVILSINNRDGHSLTHKQAQDCIKHGGGQVELIITRPPPGTQVSPLSPPIVTPRAPTLKRIPKLGEQFKAGLHDDGTPVSADYVKKKLDRLRLLYKQAQHHQAPRRPTTTEDQNGTSGDYEQADHLASGPIPKGFSKASLGGGGYNMGTGYGDSATLPRRNTGRQLSQPPSMPAGGSHGHMPTRVPISKLGGGGPNFGTDFSHIQPQQRVQGTLENIALSPRTPEANSLPPWEQPQQAPQYQSQAQQQANQQYQAPQYQAPQYQAPQAPQYQAPAQQMYTPTTILLEQQQQPQQQPQQQYHEEPQNDEGEAIVPVWERRQQYIQAQQPGVRIASTQPIPTVLKPSPGETRYGDFGVDYSQKQFKVTPAPVNVSQPAYYRPAAAQSYTPAPAHVQAPVHAPAPAPVHIIPVQTNTQSWQKPPQVDDGSGPAWGNTLRSTGVKPWEKDLFNEQEAPRSVPYNPIPAQNHAAPAPAPMSGGNDVQEGPKVVHLQYNSPMSLYSNENVQETLRGQTQVLVDQTKSHNNDKGERDWTQSQVLRLIEQDSRSGPRKAAPAPAPKPQMHQIHLQQQQPTYDEIGASDF